MAVTPEALALQAELDAQVAAISDAQVAALIAAWAAAWTEVASDLQDALLDLLVDAAAAGGKVTKAAMLRSVRLRDVLADINTRLTELTEDAGVTITSDLDQVVTDAAQAQLAIARAQLPDDDQLDDGLPDDLADLFDGGISTRTQRALDRIVKRTTEDITSRLRPVDTETAAAVRAELVRGIAVGENPRRTAARMVERTEQRFNGGLNRALVIARTELIDAHRAAAETEQGADTDVLAGWVWLAKLDTRTCPSCLVRHGELHDLDERGPDDHPQGRCARMPKTKSWRDLGIDLDEPEDVVPDARVWFDALSEDEQRTILGPTRFRLLAAGQITWEELSQQRSNPGWRESWQVAPVASLTRRTARAAS